MEVGKEVSQSVAKAEHRVSMGRFHRAVNHSTEERRKTEMVDTGSTEVDHIHKSTAPMLWVIVARYLLFHSEHSRKPP